MKLLVLILAFLVAAPPVQAGICDMEKNQDTTGHTAMKHAGMQHAKIQRDAPDTPDHDCCDTENEEKEDSCCDAMQCGQCSAGFSAILALTDRILYGNYTHRHEFAEGAHLSVHSSPPYRPPIS